MRGRLASWASAAIILLGFCWLALLASASRELFKGLDVQMPTLTKLSITYGRVAFPLFGILGTMTVIFAGKIGGRQWLQGILFAALLALIIFLFRSLMISGVFMGPTPRSSRADATAVAERRLFRQEIDAG